MFFCELGRKHFCAVRSALGRRHFGHWSFADFGLAAAAAEGDGGGVFSGY